ncbi:NAD(P)/FAD-dependent oxidoreductase [Nocardioides deserti]|uniref:NAD(P)/FAD-dependent oxidoreductase n=1 Tax=Nocardioides deserti TaxID=1588644 RepID=UPI0019A56D7C|nr:FAD-binding oxidoreductase [Nocardioides deserti]GGO70103.1 FAD-dependent oxidoreductase [Nocardioides deserti]
MWHDTAPPAPSRPPLPGTHDADVVVVGAGYTGLWTAYSLAVADPSLRIVVVEAEQVGHGASGRNGGWCSALFPASLPSLAAAAGRDAALAQHRAMRATVDEVARTAAAEGIDCHLAKGGTVVVARNRAQWGRARAEVAAARTWDRGEDDLRLLDAREATGVLRASGTVGATYTPDCAAIHPARLVRGLADACERHGVTIHESTRVTAIEPGRARTAAGDVRADVVVRATEGYTPLLPGQRRAVVPVYSLMIATEPLPQAVWDEIGLARRETFSDHRHLVIYGQRTADDRLAFGGRGAPYHLGSRVSPAFDRDERVFAGLYATLVDLFPVLAGTRVTHAWGGPLGIARDWCASVGLDRRTGLAWAGGYVGDGVATTNLAGRTLRDLVLGHDTDLVRLPWVGHHSPAWEPEPLRWLGINAGLRATRLADAEESLTRRPSLLARATAPLLG